MNTSKANGMSGLQADEFYEGETEMIAIQVFIKPVHVMIIFKEGLS